MKIYLFYEFGNKQEIGYGHKYRTDTISNELKKRRHEVIHIHDKADLKPCDVLIIDHLFTQKDLINKAKRLGIKIVLIDGAVEDVENVDISVSAMYNEQAQYKGLKYLSFPVSHSSGKHSAYTESKTVFVAMGGFDAGNLAEKILEILGKINVNAIVAKSKNHPNFREKFTRVEVFEEENYYDAMKECVMGITNGGNSLMGALYFGLPCIAIPQYEHQLHNISYVSHCCEYLTKFDAQELEEKVLWLMENEYHRVCLSRLAQYSIDGKGTNRICSLVEKIYDDDE